MVVSTAPTTTRHLGTDQQRAGTDLAAFLDADDDEKKASRFAPAKQGLNRFVWDLLHEDATRSTEDSSRRDKHEPLMRSTDCDAFSARSWRYLGGPRSQ